MDEIGLFAQLSPQGRDTLARGMSAHNFAKGDSVVEKGQCVSGAYFVLEGLLRVFTLTPSGQEATLYFIKPGETCVLALNSLFNDLLYPAWVEAEAPTRVGVASGPLYRAIFKSEPAIQDLTIRALSTLVFRLMEELEQVHSRRLDQRLASFLLNQASGDGLILKTQAEIAAHVGASREGVARLMSDFHAKGLVETGRARIRLSQPAGLAAIVKRGN